MELLFAVIAFIVAMSILVGFHEYGHFFAARRLGVKVLRFSIGFGHPLWQRTASDGTEYRLAAIPLGGYVKMLDEREQPVAESERARAFNNQSLWARAVIVLAGPAANFLLAFVVCWIMYLHGISGISPIVGQVAPQSIAEDAGFQMRDLITAVDGHAVQSWDDARLAIYDASLSNASAITIDVTDRDGYLQQRRITADLAPLLQQEGDLLEHMGLGYWRPVLPAVIDQVEPDSPAMRAGLQSGDQIVSFNDMPVDNFVDLTTLIRAMPNETASLGVTRADDGQLYTLGVTIGERELSDGESVGFLGVQARVPEDWGLFWTVSRYGFFESAARAYARVRDITLLTLKMLVKLVTGGASLSNVSGPISIAQFAGQAASIGYDHYLNFLAIISIGIGIVNLLPVPVLDGGHVVLLVAEGIKGRPLSDQFLAYAQILGLSIVGCLVVFAISNDLLRLL